jgi:hypothetical protein
MAVADLLGEVGKSGRYAVDSPSHPLRRLGAGRLVRPGWPI